MMRGGRVGVFFSWFGLLSFVKFDTRLEFFSCIWTHVSKNDCFFRDGGTSLQGIIVHTRTQEWAQSYPHMACSSIIRAKTSVVHVYMYTMYAHAALRSCWRMRL